MYRQISIAITERHVHAAAARFNRFDDTTGTAGHEVAYAWRSGHRPMQRHTTYGLDVAYPDHLQPALLRAYDRVSASWHTFLWGCDKSGEPRSKSPTLVLAHPWLWPALFSLHRTTGIST
jgi:hypothetical protein